MENKQRIKPIPIDPSIDIITMSKTIRKQRYITIKLIVFWFVNKICDQCKNS